MMKMDFNKIGMAVIGLNVVLGGMGIVCLGYAIANAIDSKNETTKTVGCRAVMPAVVVPLIAKPPQAPHP
jgi:uncharacterized membrane protein